jgi:hypothetical protein
MKGQALTITELNNTLKKEAQIETITFEEFKKLHKSQGSKLDRMVASIKSVEPMEDGYELHIDNFNDGEKVIKVRHNGKVSINGSSYRELVDNKSMHLRINHNNNSIVVEKLIMICKCIVDNELPIRFRGLCVNVMDGSGNIMTANELGIKPDYSIENLEWTLSYRNLIHGKKIYGLFKTTGRVYRYSANDELLNQIYVTRDEEQIKEYMNDNYVTVD